MKVKILSDLHVDVNSDYPFSIDVNDKTFTVLAGDIAGDPTLAINWIKSNIYNGIVVAGNHLVYSTYGLKSVAERKRILQKEFPLDGDVSYLDANVGAIAKEVDGILFIGTTLYCDFKLPTQLYKDGNAEIAKRDAQYGINDFRWGARLNVPLTTTDYANWFNESVQMIDSILTKNEKTANPKPVIVVTHFAPSLMCVQLKYKDSPLNPVFASELMPFIEKHSSIKAWIYGHIHAQQTIQTESCILVNNSRGYVAYGEDMLFNPNLALDTDNWKLCNVI